MKKKKNLSKNYFILLQGVFFFTAFMFVECFLSLFLILKQLIAYKHTHFLIKIGVGAFIQ